MKSDDTFENLEVWRDAVELAASVYGLFRECKDWEFRGQIQRAAVSISSNIARGSCGEVRSQAYLAIKVKLLSDESGETLIAEARRLSKRIGRLMDVRRTQFK